MNILKVLIIFHISHISTCIFYVILMTRNKQREDICFFEVNTKYISLSELKTSEFSRVRSTSENFDVFNSLNEIYLVFTSKKQIFFLFYTLN